MYRSGLFCAVVLLSAILRGADTAPSWPDAALILDFKDDTTVKLFHGARRVAGGTGHVLEFTSAMQHAEIDFTRKLDGATAVTVGGWFFPRRSGEQAMVFRGTPRIAPLGERMFPAQEKWVNFVIGMDSHGLFYGTAHGNGTMPFPYVTLNPVPIDEWSQLVVVKDSAGFQKFYRNGVLVGSDADSAWAPKVRAFVDQEEGEPLRLAMPMGGMIGEAWVFRGELSAEQIKADFEMKKERYRPALPAERVLIAEMDEHHVSRLWKTDPDQKTWPGERERIMAGVMKVLGAPPAKRVALDPKVISEEDCGTYIRRKISIQVQEHDRMPAYLLIPKKLKGKAPAIICMYGTTGGAGKLTTVGLSGPEPGTPPRKNHDFAVWMAEAGYVAFAADYLRDGERIKPGKRPYDTRDFYEQFPDWSIVGKDAWDNSRAVDYLQSLDFVDGERIGMMGHSYGGHSTLFAAALEPRIKAVVASGPVSDFLHHGIHWGVPKGSGGSASLPGLRPYVLDHTLPIPVTFYEFTALIAPRPLLVLQAVGERRPMEEENCAAVSQVYRALGAGERCRYAWVAGDHDVPPAARREAEMWLAKWLGEGGGRER